MYLILGLGNPGREYEKTRHNVGFQTLDLLAARHRFSLSRQGHHCLYGYGEIAGISVAAGKPLTYMNNSGRAAAAMLAAHKIPPARLLVIHDEVDFPLGKVKLKRQGGDAGQRGVRSIIECLDDDRFARLRLGIGRPECRDEMADYVLSPFSPEESPAAAEMIELAVEMTITALRAIEKSPHPTEE